MVSMGESQKESIIITLFFVVSTVVSERTFLVVVVVDVEVTADLFCAVVRLEWEPTIKAPCEF